MASRISVPSLARLAIWLSPSAIAKVIVALAEQARADGNAVQRGHGLLEGGIALVTNVALSPESVILVARSTPRGTLGAGGLVVPVETRSVLEGTFVVQSVDGSGAPFGAEGSSFDFAIFD